MGEEASANDGVLWIMQLKQERLARTQRPELPFASRLPEVHLIQVLAKA